MKWNSSFCRFVKILRGKCCHRIIRNYNAKFWTIWRPTFATTYLSLSWQIVIVSKNKFMTSLEVIATKENSQATWSVISSHTKIIVPLCLLQYGHLRMSPQHISCDFANHSNVKTPCLFYFQPFLLEFSYVPPLTSLVIAFYMSIYKIKYQFILCTSYC